MNSTVICNVTRRALLRTTRTFYSLCNPVIINIHQHNCNPPCSILPKKSNLIRVERFKHSKNKATKNKFEDSDDEDEDDYESEDEDEDDISSSEKVRKFNFRVSSPRLDSVAKRGMNITRTKIEAAFYASKLRVNGEVLEKKSSLVNEGDEIDFILKPDSVNPNFLRVHRATIHSIRFTSGGCKVKGTLEKNLLIEDYINNKQN